MSQIDTFSLSQLRHNEHFQFMADANTLMLKYDPEMLGIKAEYPEFQAALDEEDKRMTMEQGSLKSKPIMDADILRDQTWSAIKERVESTLLSPFETERESARALLRVINLYGNIKKMGYNAESAALTNLVPDLKSTNNSTYLATVGIGPWVDELGKQNNSFIVLINERNKEYAGRDSGDVRASRIVTDQAYNQLVDRINAMLLLNLAGEEVLDFVRELNEKVKYYETTISIREGRPRTRGSSS